MVSKSRLRLMPLPCNFQSAYEYLIHYQCEITCVHQMVIQVSLITLTIEPKTVITFWACIPLCFKHMSTSYLFLEPHQTTYHLNRCPIKTSHRVKYVYLTWNVNDKHLFWSFWSGLWNLYIKSIHFIERLVFLVSVLDDKPCHIPPKCRHACIFLGRFFDEKISISILHSVSCFYEEAEIHSIHEGGWGNTPGS